MNKKQENKAPVLQLAQNDQAEQPVKKAAQDIIITFNDGGEFMEGEFKAKVVTYENINGHQVGQHWVAVFLENHSTVIIPSSRIDEILVINKE
jgi:hypothetical protein